MRAVSFVIPHAVLGTLSSPVSQSLKTDSRRHTSSAYREGFLSDHSFVYAEIDARVSVRGPGVWRFNNLLLDDERFVTEAKDALRKCKDGEAPYESHAHS